MKYLLFRLLLLELGLLNLSLAKGNFKVNFNLFSLLRTTYIENKVTYIHNWSLQRLSQDLERNAPKI